MSEGKDPEPSDTPPGVVINRNAVARQLLPENPADVNNSGVGVDKEHPVVECETLETGPSADSSERTNLVSKTLEPISDCGPVILVAPVAPVSDFDGDISTLRVLEKREQNVAGAISKGPVGMESHHLHEKVPESRECDYPPRCRNPNGFADHSRSDTSPQPSNTSIDWASTSQSSREEQHNQFFNLRELDVNRQLNSPVVDSQYMNGRDPTSDQEEMYRMSPDDDDMITSPASRFYKCRFCNFSAATYTQLQLHVPKHGGHLKALKCPFCDYATNDKSNFRRHRRLHARNNPVNVLKCGKCSFTTILPRKIREHYQRVHNEHLPPDISETASYEPQRFLNGQFGMGHIELSPTNCPVSSGPVTVAPIHTLLTTAHAGGYHYSTNARQPMENCMVNQYGNVYTSVSRRQTDENNMASNYLRSIVSSIMNSHHQTRVPATSTMTSSSFFMPQTVESTQLSPVTPQRRLPHTHEIQDVKIKVEPIECDGTSDVSSSATPYSNAPYTPDIQCSAEAQSTRRSYRESVEDSLNRSNEASSTNHVLSGQNMQRPSRTHRPSPDDLTSSRQDTRLSMDSSAMKTTIKTETTNIGIQCELPVVKPESLVQNGTYIQDGIGGRLIRVRGVERGVQCEILNTVRTQKLSNRAQSVASESEMSEHQSSISGDSRCCHCGITFDDEVLFSIHIGCHSHTDPFICNVCGKQCGNKYGFYSHIMRGHQF
ncbi:hypothetical protein ACJMK2_006300 [Sinanodonta woodiana]|uniref:C2H2-type domain-containing protein n=1 Tax=Sinanodonta woodiana TaxID=1069815 RepID=A0ABD3VSR7_SINWO